MPIYGKFPANAMGMGGATQTVDWLLATIKCGLTTSSYTPDQDTHDFYNDITNELSTANGYTAGGATLASKTVTYDSATNESRFDAADVVWTSTGAGFTARRFFVYKDSGVAATSTLIMYDSFSADQTASGGGTLTISWASDGVFKFTAS
jgi:hypothetical protein